MGLRTVSELWLLARSDAGDFFFLWLVEAVRLAQAER